MDLIKINEVIKEVLGPVSGLCGYGRHRGKATQACRWRRCHRNDFNTSLLTNTGYRTTLVSHDIFVNVSDEVWAVQISCFKVYLQEICCYDVIKSLAKYINLKYRYRSLYNMEGGVSRPWSIKKRRSLFFVFGVFKKDRF